MINSDPNFEKKMDGVLEVLNKKAPIKRKILTNDKLFMNKTLRKAIMHRSRLRAYSFLVTKSATSTLNAMNTMMP